MGLTPETASKGIDALVANNKIDKATGDAYKYGIATLTSGKYFSNELERFKQAGGTTGAPAAPNATTGQPAAPATAQNKPAPATSAESAAAAVAGNRLTSIIAPNMPRPAMPSGFPSTQSGRWVDKNGNTVTGIDPGFDMGNRFVPDAPQPVRSSTSSPGIGKDGNRISYNDEEAKKRAQNKRLLRM